LRSRSGSNKAFPTGRPAGTEETRAKEQYQVHSSLLLKARRNGLAANLAHRQTHLRNTGRRGHAMATKLITSLWPVAFAMRCNVRTDGYVTCDAACVTFLPESIGQERSLPGAVRRSYGQKSSVIYVERGNLKLAGTHRDPSILRQLSRYYLAVRPLLQAFRCSRAP
jgi:hypothetical protein